MPTNEKPEWQNLPGAHKYKGLMSRERMLELGLPLEHVVISPGFEGQSETQPPEETQPSPTGLKPTNKG